MDKSNNPYSDLDLGELAQVCDERAEALEARAWRNEAERNALREATAQLLSAVAQQLNAAPCSQPVQQLSAADLEAIIRDRVEHQPLHADADARHAWIGDDVPGSVDGR